MQTKDLLQIYTMARREFLPKEFVRGFSFLSFLLLPHAPPQSINLGGLQQIAFQQKSGLTVIAVLIAMSDIS